MIKKSVFALCLFTVTVFAQNAVLPVAEVDSAAYYGELSDYNYRKFRTDEAISDVLFWTTVGLGVLAPISGIMLGAKSMGCDVNEDNDCDWSALDWGLITPLFLVFPSLVAYESFSFAKFVRKRKYNEYYRKREDYVKRRQLENGKEDEVSLSIQLMPWVNPIESRCGAVLALNF